MSLWRNITREELARYRRETNDSTVDVDELFERSRERFKKSLPNYQGDYKSGIERTLRQLRDDGEVKSLGGGSYRIENLSLDTDDTTQDGESDISQSEGAVDESETGPLAGSSLVFTGSLTGFSRRNLQDRVRSLGGTAPARIQDTVDYLIAGSVRKQSTKPKKAVRKGVPLISEFGFKERFPDTFEYANDYPTFSLSTEFEEVLRTYSTAQSDSDWDHPAVEIVKSRIPSALIAQLPDEDLRIDQSVGMGRMANVPWIGVFDPRTSSGPTDGLYIVYLVDQASETLYLTLNQGMTDLKDAVGLGRAGEILSQRAEILREFVDVPRFDNEPIDITSDLLTNRNKHYGPAAICHRTYQAGEFPHSDEELLEDIRRLTDVYQQLASRGVYDKLIDAFDETAGEQHNPFSDDEKSVTPHIDVSEDNDHDVMDRDNNLGEEFEDDTPEKGETGEDIEAETEAEVEAETEQDTEAQLSEPDYASVDHPLFEYLETAPAEPTVWTASLAPDDWLTALQHGALPLRAREAERASAVSKGDVVLFYSQPRPTKSSLDAVEAGLVGGGIASGHGQKKESWWKQEFDGTVDYPQLVELESAYVTGPVERLDLETHTVQKSDEELQDEVEALTANLVPDETLDELSHSHRDRPFRTGRPLTPTSTTAFCRHLLALLSNRLSLVPYDSDTDSQLEPRDKPLRADEIERQLTDVGQVVFHGPPGTGKTYIANKFARWWLNETEDNPTEDQLRLATFHPSFSYEDFMEGLTADATGDGQVTYEIEAGVFKRIAEDARRAYLDAKILDKTAQKYILVIDEINRGNLSKIFGETITQLESSKRLDKDQEIEIELAHSGDTFVVPPNLYLIGTMNTADRSIALVDAALRRRFSFHDFPPEYDVFHREYDHFENRSEIVGAADTDDQTFEPMLARSIIALYRINNRILDVQDLGKGKQVGHSYLLELKSIDDLVRTWRYQILPLLSEYYFGDVDRLVSDLFQRDVTSLFDSDSQQLAELDKSTLDVELKLLRDQPGLEFVAAEANGS